MRAGRRTLAAALVLGICGASACAVADDTDYGGMVGDAHPADAKADSGAHDSGASVDSGSPPSDSGAAVDSGGALDDSGAGPIDSGVGPVDSGALDTGIVDTGPIDAGPPACTIASTSDCSGAPYDLGSISGDSGSDVVTAHGSDGQFLRVRATEDDSSIFATNLSMRIDLQGPASEDFDVYVYLGKTNANGGGVECNTIHSSGTAIGDDSVKVSWKDSQGLGGADDTREVSIEVRPKSLTCDPTLSWTLIVSGDV